MAIPQCPRMLRRAQYDRKHCHSNTVASPVGIAWNADRWRSLWACTKQMPLLNVLKRAQWSRRSSRSMVSFNVTGAPHAHTEVAVRMLSMSVELAWRSLRCHCVSTVLILCVQGTFKKCFWFYCALTAIIRSCHDDYRAPVVLLPFPLSFSWQTKWCKFIRY
jgi:hypothetical protein